MRFIVSIIFILSFLVSDAQTLIEEAQKVKDTYSKLSEDPNSKDLQKEYLDVFPKTRELFLKIFNPIQFDQLYGDSFKYISILKSVWNNYPDQVADLLINLCKDLEKDVDAISFLQHLTTKFAADKTGMFYTHFSEISTDEQVRLIAFLANVEDHSAYKDYQKLIDNLKSAGNNKLAKMFIKARKNRPNKKEKVKSRSESEGPPVGG